MGDDGPPGGLVVELVTVESWRLWRDVRLASLIDSPRAFWMTYAESAGMPDDHWRERAATAGPTWLALDDGHPVGTVGLWHAPDQPDDEVVLVGMWVATVARGTDVATRLVETALAQCHGIRVSAGGARRGARERAGPSVLHPHGLPSDGRRGPDAVGPVGHRGDAGARPAGLLLKFALGLQQPAGVVGEWPP